MAIDFPNTPTLNQTYAVGSKTWKYDGEKWVIINSSVALSLDGLTDAVITYPASGQVLEYNGSLWVNKNTVRDNMLRFYMEVL